MANALTLTAAAMPTANAGTAGIKGGANSNGTNSAAWTFAGGASGAGDTIANAELLKGVSAKSRLYSFLSASYATQADLNAAMAAVGFMGHTQNGSLLTLVTAAPGVPTATMTTSAATGALRISIAASISA